MGAPPPLSSGGYRKIRQARTGTPINRISFYFYRRWIPCTKVVSKGGDTVHFLGFDSYESEEEQGQNNSYLLKSPFPPCHQTTTHGAAAAAV